MSNKTLKHSGIGGAADDSLQKIVSDALVNQTLASAEAAADTPEAASEEAAAPEEAAPEAAAPEAAAPEAAAPEEAAPEAAAPEEAAPEAAAPEEAAPEEAAPEVAPDALPIEQAMSLFYASLKQDITKSVLSAIQVNNQDISKNFVEGMSTLARSNILRGGDGDEDESPPSQKKSDSDHELRMLFKNINNLVDETHKIPESDIDGFIQHKDTITEKVASLSLQKPRVRELLQSFTQKHTPPTNLNADFENELHPEESESVFSHSNTKPNEESSMVTTSPFSSTVLPASVLAPPTSENKEPEPEPPKSSSWLERSASFFDKASKAADFAIKAREIATSPHPMEAIQKAEANGSIDAATANRLRATYETAKSVQSVAAKPKPKTI